MSPSPQELERALAERHKPLLVLYPEISSETRAHRRGWRALGQPPLLEDYHPRDVGIVFDHARLPGWRLPRGRPEHQRERLLRELEENRADRIDILSGAGHADRDRFWAAYHAIVGKQPPHERDETYPRRAYARIAYGEDVAAAAPDQPPPYAGLVAIEYWLFYLYNDWKSTHEGDWELVVVFLRQAPEAEGEPEPVACAYSAHHGGYRFDWRHVEKVDGRGERSEAGPHPVAYVANGSHANYYFGPARYTTSTRVFGARITSGEFPFTGEFIDFTTSLEEGERVFPEVRLVPPSVDGRWAGEWGWLNFRGEWGSLGVPRWLRVPLRLLPKRLRFRLERRAWAAPASLPTRRNWHDPFTWADLECDEAPLPGSWLAARTPGG